MSPCAPQATILELGELDVVDDFQQFLRRHMTNPVFRALRTLGPRYIADCLEDVIGSEIHGEGCRLCLVALSQYRYCINGLVTSCEFSKLLDLVELEAKRALDVEGELKDE